MYFNLEKSHTKLIKTLFATIYTHTHVHMYRKPFSLFFYSSTLFCFLFNNDDEGNKQLCVTHRMHEKVWTITIKMITMDRSEGKKSKTNNGIVVKLSMRATYVEVMRQMRPQKDDNFIVFVVFFVVLLLLHIQLLLFILIVNWVLWHGSTLDGEYRRRVCMSPTPIRSILSTYRNHMNVVGWHGPCYIRCGGTKDVHL